MRVILLRIEKAVYKYLLPENGEYHLVWVIPVISLYLSITWPLTIIHSYIQYDLTRSTASSAEIGVLLGYRATMIWKNYYLMWTKMPVVA